ncbi:MAG: nucleotidyltransferase domain-containing protein [Nitrososphaerales archaeon]
MKQMVQAEKLTLCDLFSLLRKHPKWQEHYFGSVSKGEGNEDSDIDLLVVSNDFDARA